MVELADRSAIHELSVAYAHHVDRREPSAVGALFTEDGVLAIYNGDPASVPPDRVRTGRDEIVTALEGLARYDVTTHLIGQHTIELDGDHATGETYCMAHHISTLDDGTRHDHVLSIRYLDTYRRIDGEWRIEQRQLAIDWTDERDLPRS